MMVTFTSKKSARLYLSLAVVACGIMGLSGPGWSEDKETTKECVSGDNPNEGGFFKGIRNLTGKRRYKCRVEEKEGALSEEEARRSTLLDRAAALQAENEELETQLESTESRLQKLNDTLSDLRTELDNASSDKQAAQLRLMDIEQKLAATQNRLQLVKAERGEEKIGTDEALTDIEEISNALDEIDAVIEELGGASN